MHIHINQEDIIIEEGLDIFVIKRKRVGKAHGNCQTIFKCAKMGKAKAGFKPKDFFVLGIYNKFPCICHSPATILFLIGTICKAGFSNPSLDKIQYLCALYMSFCTKTENDMGFRYLLCRTEQCQ